MACITGSLILMRNAYHRCGHTGCQCKKCTHITQKTLENKLQGFEPVEKGICLRFMLAGWRKELSRSWVRAMHDHCGGPFPALG